MTPTSAIAPVVSHDASAITAPTRFIETRLETYAYPQDAVGRHRAAGGEDIMHLEKPELRRILEDPSLTGYQVLVKLFFSPSESSQAAARRS